MSLKDYLHTDEHFSDSGTKIVSMGCKYRSEVAPDYECKEPPEPGSDYCIFHSPSPDPDKFKERLKKQLEGKGRNPRYSFVGYRFPPDWQWDEVLSRKVFSQRADFRGSMFGTGTDFGGARFYGGADFEEAMFWGKTSFWWTKFYGDTSFSRAEFRGHTLFPQTCFGGKANFWRAKFGGNTHFCEASFSGDVDFEGVEFGGNASFQGAKFDKDASFQGTKFGGNANFRDSHFAKEVVFRKASFSAEALFVGKGDNRLFESVIDFREVDLAQPKMLQFHHVDLSKCLLRGTDVQEVDFVDVRWAEKGLFSFFGHDVMKRQAVYDEIYSLEKGDWKALPEIEKLYRQLTHNYENARSYSLAGHFHCGAMEMVRKQHRSWWRRNVFSLVALYRYLAGYGEYPSWPLTVLAVAWVLLAVGFYFLHPTGESWRRLGWALLHSAQALVFRGAPEGARGLTQALGFIGSIIGAMQIAFFLIAIRRRFKR